MAKFLLDTPVLIDHRRGQRKVVELLLSLAREGHQLGVCCVNIAELYANLSEKERGKAERLVDNLEDWGLPEI